MAALSPSALARPLDFRYGSNRLAALGLLGVTLLARRRGQSWPQALSAGGAAFAAWATARELDPDYPQTANAALPVAAALVLLGRPGTLAILLPSLTALSGLRVIAGTTGQAATQSDLTGLLVQGLLTAGTGGQVGAAVAGAAPLLTPSARSAVPLMGALLPTLTTGGRWSWLGAGLSLAALPLTGTLTAPEAVQSVCDRAGRPVRAAEVQRARQVAAAALMVGLLTRQTRGLLPLAAACLTVAARREGAKLKASSSRPLPS
ncbi:hypothetical protein GO986_05635 [Deinococcus sp. HMF7620]|uniref:Uncharacterized protein n=1 Tax=Deinococcus arboris TaxID=2682977 RepID=A0A7C9M0P8_9DEIO|nr:hypothetical protein [Deinococcus arboris]MVN86242.1 hypothetical protein [Deinococcus arboris]